MSLQKILFLMVDGFDTPTSINQLIETLLCDILDAGIKVHMISGRKGGSLPDVPDTLAKRPGFTYDIVDRGSVVEKTNFVKRFLDDYSYVKKARDKWEKVIDDVDCVLMQSTPLGAFHVSALKRHGRVPVVYNMYDIFPDNTKDVIGALPYVLFSVIQSRLYRLCDKIVVISEDMIGTLKGKGVPERKLSAIPVWYDDRSVSEVARSDNHFVSKYGIDTNKFVVQFAGSFGYVFDCDFILGTAERLRDHPDIEFHMIGQGARLDSFRHAVEEQGLSSVKFFPWQPIEEIADVYSACTIGVIPLEKGVIRCAYPSKTSLLMACGRPVLYSVEEDSSFAETVRRERTGWIVPRGDCSAAAGAIRRLVDDPIEVSEYSERARRYARTNLSRRANTARFIEVLKEACKR